VEVGLVEFVEGKKNGFWN